MGRVKSGPFSSLEVWELEIPLPVRLLTLLQLWHLRSKKLGSSDSEETVIPSGSSQKAWGGAERMCAEMFISGAARYGTW